MLTRRAFVAGTALAAGQLAAAEPDAGSVRRLPLAFLGTGYSHFEGKYRVAMESPDFEVIGACSDEDPVPGRIHPAPRRISFDELAARSEVVVVESEVRRHAADARRALEAGKHVHLEKPPADTLSEFDALLELAARQRRQLQVGYMWRHNPGMIALLDAARAGALGEVFLVRASMNTLVGPEERKRWAHFPGGAMFEQGCHLVDVVVRLLGRPTRVTPFLQRLGQPADNLADNTVAILEFSRALAIITSAPRQPEAGPHRFVEIVGTRGSGRLQPIEPSRLTLDLSQSGGDYPAGRHEVALPQYRRYEGDLAALASAIRGQKALPASQETERLVQETVLRACGMT